jgi:putative NADH-flavin reductase
MREKNTIQSILILGGTGKTGEHVVKQTLAKGFQVTVLLRKPESLKELIHHPNLEVLKGDVLHYPDIYNAVQGNDAIISALGRDGKKSEVLTKGTENIIRAIAQSSIQKFVCLSSLGAGSTKKLAGWKLRWMIRLAGLQNSFDAKAQQEVLLYQSEINFTLVMAASLNNRVAQENVLSFSLQQAPYLIGKPLKISRQSVANFMIDQLESNSWKRKTVCLASA